MTSRIGICVIVATSLLFSYLCISSHAPMIEEEIAVHCREVLTGLQIKPDGLSVSGRDVMLTGLAGSAIISSHTRTLLEHVAGVRVVKTQIVTTETPSSQVVPRTETQLRPEARAVQERINLILQDQPIDFKPDTPVLTPHSRAVLDLIVPVLARAPNMRCEIRGNSTAASNGQHEWMMSLQRSLATEDYLVSKGIADWRLSAQVFPITTGPNGKSEGRQIEFVVKER